MEYRPGQVEAAVAIYEACARSRPLIVEAGTGTGKTLAYLLAFHLVLEGRPESRFCVSTYTRALQDQVFSKDLPILAGILGPRFAFRPAVAYGSGNYLCLMRLRQETPHLDQEAAWARLDAWARSTDEGLFREIEIPAALRERVCRDPDLCPRQRCPFYGRCFFYRSRHRLGKSNLLILNHHLLFASLSGDTESLPPFGHLLLDEAHQVEDVATDFFRTEVSLHRTRALLARWGRGEKGLLKAVGLDASLAGTLGAAIALFEREVSSWFAELGRRVEVGEGERVRLRDPVAIEEKSLVAAADAAVAAFERVSGTVGEEYQPWFLSAAHQVAQVRDGILDFLRRPRPEDIYTVERSSEGLSFSIIPLTVAERFQSHVLDRLDTVVFTSATLSVAGRFDHFRSLVSTRGSEIDALAIPHAFDFLSQALLYVPEPSRQIHEDPSEIADEVVRLAGTVPGGIFVLFTNAALMARVRSILEERLDRPLLCQNPAVSSYALVERFRTFEDAVLLGTQSFWQGVDIPENRLRGVIITRLPFPVPSDPVVKARSEWYDATTGNGFRDYCLPKAVIMLKQGFGRLIRGPGDRGVVAVLDTRLRSRWYGRVFLSSLPPVRLVSDLSEVERFFEGTESPGGVDNQRGDH